MTYPVLKIADEILRIAKSKGDSLKPLKLMKLTYISLGWYLANRDEPLFTERVEAWKYGPVIPDLYHATKKYGRDEIPANLIDEVNIATDEDTREFLTAVYEQYGGKSGIYLSNLTHKSGTPWDKRYIPEMMGVEIPLGLIKQHYKSDLGDR